MKKEKVWFPWKNRYAYVPVNEKTKAGLANATKIGRVYWCTLPTIEAELMPYAYDFHEIGERLY